MADAKEPKNRNPRTVVDMAAAAERRYPIVHTVIVGKGDARSSGFVTASEVGGEGAIEALLRLGAISDPDAPLRPSEASDAKARTIVTDIALAAGVITRDGERFKFDDRALSAAELSAIPLTELSDSIVARCNGAS